MKKILVVGNATVDIINHVNTTPQEDDEVRAESQTIAMGGNSANTAIVLSMLGHKVTWIGTLADDANSAIIENTFNQYQVNFSKAERVKGGVTPTSYISLSQDNGSRTIVHHREIPELSFKTFKKLDIEEYNWIHFEGRNVSELKKMIARINSEASYLRYSLEVEKPRDNIESLFDDATLLLFSHHYAEDAGFNSAEALVRTMGKNHPDQIISCTWGAEGAYGYDQGELFQIPPEKISAVVDTIGAGDVYNAGVISSLAERDDALTAMTMASKLAAAKCAQFGMDGLTPS